jgi:thiol-disulfide isomerase/thioredoxin
MKRVLIAILIMIFAVACGDNSAKSSEASADIQTVSKGFIDQLKAEHAGKVMIVNFFASWCPPCRGETPDFVEAYEKHKDGNFVIVGLSVDKKAEDAVKFINEYKITYPVYLADNSLGAEMNISTIPTSIIYKPDGKLFDIVVGPLTSKELDIIAGSFSN